MLTKYEMQIILDDAKTYHETLHTLGMINLDGSLTEIGKAAKDKLLSRLAVLSKGVPFSERKISEPEAIRDVENPLFIGGKIGKVEYFTNGSIWTTAEPLEGMVNTKLSKAKQKTYKEILDAIIAGITHQMYATTWYVKKSFFQYDIVSFSSEAGDVEVNINGANYDFICSKFPPKTIEWFYSDTERSVPCLVCKVKKVKNSYKGIVAAISGYDKLED